MATHPIQANQLPIASIMMPTAVLSANRTSDVYEVLGGRIIAIQVNWGLNCNGGTPAVLDASDGTVKLQVSEDGVNFNDKSGFTTITFSDVSGTQVQSIDTLRERYVRVVCAKGSATAGTIEVYFNVQKV